MQFKYSYLILFYSYSFNHAGYWYKFMRRENYSLTYYEFMCHKYFNKIIIIIKTQKCIYIIRLSIRIPKISVMFYIALFHELFKHNKFEFKLNFYLK